MSTLSYRRGSLDYGVLTAQPFGHLRSGRQSIQVRSFGVPKGYATAVFELFLDGLPTEFRMIQTFQHKKKPGPKPGLFFCQKTDYCMATRVTRRFSARPSLVELSPMGLYSP